MGTFRFRPSLERLEDRTTPATPAELYVAAIQTQANAEVIARVMRDPDWMAFPAARPLVQRLVTNLYQQSMSAAQNLSQMLPQSVGLVITAQTNAAFAQNIGNWLGFSVVPPPAAPPIGDAPGPRVTINKAATQADPANSSPITFAVVFSEPVTGFTSSDVSFTGSTVGGTLAASVSGSGSTYTVTVTGMGGDGNVVARILANAATDAAGNGNTASTSTDNSVTFDDIVAPTVTINQGASQLEPTNNSPITFNVVFSEPVTGFTAADIAFTGSTASGTLAASVSGTGPTFTVTVTGMSGDGTVVASIPASAVTDLGANANTASTSTDNSVTFTTTAPTDAGMTTSMPDPSAPEWVARPNGLKTWDVVVGTGDPVVAGDSISVFYAGWLASDGTQFDSRRSPAAPVTFSLNGLIQGWQQGIPGMMPGGIRRLFVPAALGYGAAGSPPSVPPNADLVFEIKLIAHT